MKALKHKSLKQLVAAINYREAELVPVRVTWYNRKIAPYTPRVRAAIDAVRRAQLAARIVWEDKLAQWRGDEEAQAGLTTCVRLAIWSEASEEWPRITYLVEVVTADLGPAVGAALAVELGLDQPEESFFNSPEWTTPEMNDYGSCPACAASEMGGRLVVEPDGEIRCNCCGYYVAI
jgi:hypothetical protein